MYSGWKNYKGTETQCIFHNTILQVLTCKLSVYAAHQNICFAGTFDSTLPFGLLTESMIFPQYLAILTAHEQHPDLH